MRRDGDLTPFSMTIALLASNADRCIPHPEKRPPAHLCGLGAAGWVGLGIKMFSGSHVGKYEGAFGPATLKRNRNHFAIPRMSSGPLPVKVVGSGAVAQTLVPCVETAT